MPAVPPPNQAVADLVSLLGEANVRVLIRTFLRECPRLIEQMAQGDRRTQERVAHNLKSNARIVGAVDLSAQMNELELRLHSPEGADLTPAEIAAIGARFAAVAAPLRDFATEPGE